MSVQWSDNIAWQDTTGNMPWTLQVWPYPERKHGVCPGCGRCQVCGRKEDQPWQWGHYPWWYTVTVTDTDPGDIPISGNS